MPPFLYIVCTRKGGIFIHYDVALFYEFIGALLDRYQSPRMRMMRPCSSPT